MRLGPTKRVTKRDLAVASLALAVAMVFWVVAGAFAHPSTGLNENVSMRGTLSIYKDGTQVYHTDDVVTYSMYSFVVCKVFNDSTACSGAGSNYAGFSTGCSTEDVGSATIVTSSFYSRTMCSAIGVGISTSNSSPTAGGTTCATTLTTNGLAPVKATTSFALNTNTVSLTASWTATAAQSNIQQVYLYPYNDYSGAVVPGSAYTSGNCFALAADTFSAQSLSTGQSLSVVWTFTF